VIQELPELIHTVDVQNELGEGVVWNEATSTVWWTDIERSTLFEYHLGSGGLKSWNTPHRVGSFGFVENDHRLIVAFDCGIAFFDLSTLAVQWLYGPDVLANGLRFNDGKIDPFGVFWAGTMVEKPEEPKTFGSLYSIDSLNTLTEHIINITTSNGLCWSPDGSILYHADSPRRTIWRYRYDPEKNTITDKQTFAKTGEGMFPDGSTVDRDGGVWNAYWGGAQIARYRNDGEKSLVLEVPVDLPSCVAFGGDDLNLLFVTTARLSLSDSRLKKRPKSGSLLIYRTNFQGLPASRFKL